MTAGLAGALRERIAIEARVDSRDGIGGADGAWSVVANSWGAVAPEPHDGPDPRWRVTLRSAAAVTFVHRLAWRGRKLRVRAILIDPRLPDRIVIGTEEER